ADDLWAVGHGVGPAAGGVTGAGPAAAREVTPVGGVGCVGAAGRLVDVGCGVGGGCGDECAGQCGDGCESEDGADHGQFPSVVLARSSATRAVMTACRSSSPWAARYMARRASRSVHSVTCSGVGAGCAAGASGSGSTVW